MGEGMRPQEDMQPPDLSDHLPASLQVKAQASLAWAFIVERRIEALEVFQAIQTHRVILALLTQQALFIEELAEGDPTFITGPGCKPPLNNMCFLLWCQMAF